MIRINQLKLDIHHTEAELKAKICKLLRIREDALLSYTRKKQSLDARKKPQLFYVYTVDVTLKNEQNLIRRVKKQKSPHIQFIPEEKKYSLTASGTQPPKHRPVIVGTGPAGLFCGYELARLGYRPILLERGACVEERLKDVEAFWNSNVLNPRSNVQFGEGGAGTFSDGKLNTLVHDSEGRNARVLEIFVEHGAPEEILYQNKPHLGTDVLAKVVKNIRESIISRGGEVRFHSQATDIVTVKENGARKISALEVRGSVDSPAEMIETEIAVLAVGHSARDTFSMLQERDIPMEAKSFAVGVRMEHPQELINLAQYGAGYDPKLPAAAYKLTEKLPDGRGVYTFCMCPGGYVVNASSEEGRLAVNGMSYHDRGGVNANSAVIVTVTPEDYMAEENSAGCCPAAGPERTAVLSGIKFQRRLEEAAYRAGNGKIPVQLFKDFCDNRPSDGPGEIIPQMKGQYAWGNVRGIFPENLAIALEEGIRSFGIRLKGYSRPDAVVSGVESRTSSPVRILRDVTMQSSEVAGLYPCGEGAGYAGGITSAAIDGLKVAQAIAHKYRPF